MGKKGTRTVSRSEYREYIRSPEWQEVRKRYFASKLPKECYVCGLSNSVLHLHHRTYKNLGNERLMDLVPLCPEHHFAVHEFHRETNFDLWKATRVYRRNFVTGSQRGLRSNP